VVKNHWGRKKSDNTMGKERFQGGAGWEKKIGTKRFNNKNPSKQKGHSKTSTEVMKQRITVGGLYAVQKKREGFTQGDIKKRKGNHDQTKKWGDKGGDGSSMAEQDGPDAEEESSLRRW